MGTNNIYCECWRIIQSISDQNCKSDLLVFSYGVGVDCYLVDFYIVQGSVCGIDRLSFHQIQGLKTVYDLTHQKCTFPNAVYCLLSLDMRLYVMKNWLPLELGPLFAIEMTPLRSCLIVSTISSSNGAPYILSLTFPVPVGSPPWMMNPKVNTNVPLMLRWKRVLSYLLLAARARKFLAALGHSSQNSYIFMLPWVVWRVSDIFFK